MRGSREEMKVRLMQKAERRIDALLDWAGQTDGPTLAQIEAEILKIRQEFSEEMAQEIIVGQEARQPVDSPLCPECGQAMVYKGQKEVAPQTWVGEVRIERGYYYCPRCRRGLFPPG